MRDQWAQFPPLPVMVAHYLGAAKPKQAADQLARLEDQDVIPTTKLSATEFEQLLARMGLPTTPPTAP